jgi:exodeoxyribonuclease-3
LTLVAHLVAGTSLKSRRQRDSGPERVKIATFNINNVNKRLENLLAWLATAPDVICLQELKAEQRAFPADAIRALGYEAVWQGERSWNGGGDSGKRL